MSLFWIITITLFSYWALGMVIYWIGGENEDVMLYWGAGLLYPILYVIMYPVRAMRTYSRSQVYFEDHGISRLQYLFGKRVKHHDKD